ncbi:MAG TPA: hypothetical protein VGM42_10695 [Rhodopila sp.]
MRTWNACKSWTLAAVFIAGALGLGTGLAIARQPEMAAALHALEAAEGHLQRVTPNKGGHAAAARRLIAEAIGEVRAGIEVGREHGQ